MSTTLAHVYVHKKNCVPRISSRSFRDDLVCDPIFLPAIVFMIETVHWCSPPEDSSV